MRTWVPITITTLGLLVGCGGSDSAGTTSAADRTSDPPTTVVDATVDTTAAPGVATTVPAGNETTAPPGTDAPTTTVGDTGPAALEPETDAERGAVAAAATDEGRRWAVGLPSGTERAAGDPYLVGYTVLVTDGTTDYTVVVLGTEAVPYFTSGDVMYVSQETSILYAVPAETARQTAAVESAVAWMKAEGIEVTGRGIEAYRVMFPSTEPPTSIGTFHPQVEVYADQATIGSTFASGGPDAR